MPKNAARTPTCIGVIVGTIEALLTAGKPANEGKEELTMSAFICGPDHFTALGLFASRRQGHHGGGHLTVDPRYVEGLPDAALEWDGVKLATAYANILYQQNIASVRARYPSDKWSDLPGPINKQLNIVVTGKDACSGAYLGLKPVDILKMCDCLEYQSCESDDWEQTLAFRLLNHIRRAAIRSLAGYEKAPWDYSIAELAA